MELIFIFAVIPSQVILIHLFEVVEIVGAFGIHTFVDDKVSAFFLWDKGISTVRAPQFSRGEAAFVRRESGSADFAQELSFGAVVPV